MTHYLIPAADLEFGAFSTHNTLEQGYMRVIMWTNRATIRRWRGDSSTPPEDAAVIFNAGINFGKPNVDIFEVPLLFQDALRHLTDLCRAGEADSQATPDRVERHFQPPAVSRIEPPPPPFHPL
jgi:hypothetical protein